MIVMWEHVTPSDHGLTAPPPAALFKITDARAVQFWDDERALSRAMVGDLPADTVRSVAEIDSGRTAVAWDCIALYRAGTIWGDHLPVPAWAGRPVWEEADTMLVHLRAIERIALVDSTR